VSKTRVLIAIIAAALVMPSVIAGQKAKPPKPPAVANCVFEQQVNSSGATVQVGRDVATYGNINQPLFIHGDLLPPLGSTSYPNAVAELRALGPDVQGFYGPYQGQIRLLDNRLDYYFDTMPNCVVDSAAPNRCRFRLIVADGTAVYERVGKTRTLVGIAFNAGRTLVDYRLCDPTGDASCYVKLYGCYDDRDCPSGEGYVYADVYVTFQ
jgi:hypothetical protein